MATEAQVLANRRNSLKSTGPRTEAGKSVTRMNALKSGLHAESLVIWKEDPAALAALSAEYHAQFAPATPVERDLVDTLVHDQWLIRRFRRTEAEIFHYKEHFIGGMAWEILPKVYHAIAEDLARIQPRLNSVERSYHRALKQLGSAGASPAPVAEGDEPAAASAGTAEGAAIGFVPQTDPQPVPPAEPAPVASVPGSRIGFVPPIRGAGCQPALPRTSQPPHNRSRNESLTPEIGFVSQISAARHQPCIIDPCAS
jgi:hypothetical protein